MDSPLTFLETIKHIPIYVNFAGLRGTTQDMQRDGWEFNFDSRRVCNSRIAYEIIIFGKNRQLGLYCVSNTASIDHSAFLNNYNTALQMLRSIGFNIRICAESINFQIVHNGDFNARPIDFQSDFIDIGSAVKNLHIEDVCIFKPFHDSDELFIPSQKIEDTKSLLTRVLDLQKDKQAEIRKKIIDQRIRDGKERNFKAETSLKLVAI